MSETVREVMSDEPVTLDVEEPVLEAARRMRDENIGDVICVKGGTIAGILTDRDVVVRCVAEGRDVETCTIGEICSREVVTIEPDASIDEAVKLMRKHAIRRLVVAEDDQPIGIVSLGDLAVERDRKSALGDISAAPPNQ